MYRKILIWSFVALCLFCHHRLFGRHARACGPAVASVAVAPSCGVAVQQFAFAQPQVFVQPSFAVAAPLAVVASPAVQVNAVGANVHVRRTIFGGTVVRVR